MKRKILLIGLILQLSLNANENNIPKQIIYIKLYADIAAYIQSKLSNFFSKLPLVHNLSENKKQNADKFLLLVKDEGKPFVAIYDFNKLKENNQTSLIEIDESAYYKIVGSDSPKIEGLIQNSFCVFNLDMNNSIKFDMEKEFKDIKGIIVSEVDFVELQKEIRNILY